MSELTKTEHLSAARDSLSKQENPSLHYLRNLNLQYLVVRLVEKCLWDPSEAQEAVRKYKNFLTLRCLYPDMRVVPTYEIDEVWHNHILHTKMYADDCNQIFGSYFHHYPLTGKDHQEQKIARENYLKTGRFYEALFHESYEHAFNIAFWSNS